MMAERGSCDVVCDLCEDKHAVSFCDECHSKVCTFCQALHVRQKQTYTHNLTTIEKVKLLLLNVKCSFCDGQAERFCSECNIRLCTKCAVSHHKRCDIPGSPKQASGDHAFDGQEITATYGVSDRTKNLMKNSNEGLFHDSSKILIQDSVSQRSTIIVKDFHVQSDVFCYFCEEEIAACFCEDCQKQMCAFCQQGHMKQKRTKFHKLSEIEYTKRSILHTICSSCNQHAGKVCNRCEVPFCTKCSDAHHNLTDTLMPRRKISNTEPECKDQVSGRLLRPGSLVYKSDTMNATLLSPESGINQVRFHQVGDQECDGEVSGKVNKSKRRSDEGGTGKCVNSKGGQAFQDFRACRMAEDVRPPTVFCNKCDEAAASYCDTCKFKLCTFCHEAHTRQNATKDHILTDIEKIKLSHLNITYTLCPECILLLCAQCAWVHHKLSDIKATLQQQCGNKPSDEEVNSRNKSTLDEKTGCTINEINNAVTSIDSGKTLSNESTQPTSSSSAPVALNAVQNKTNCICDLREEQAISFCDKCKFQLGHFCTEAHKIQKQAKEHKFCAGIAGKFCFDCDTRMCTKCSDAHHNLSDTLTLTTPTTRQCGTKPSTEENVPDPAFPFRDDAAPIMKTESFYSSVDISTGHGRKGDTPGKPNVDTINTDSIDIVWAGVDSFCEGDVYQVRTKNIHKTNYWHDQEFKMNNGKVTGLEPGASYTFKVRLVKANGEDSRFSDESEKVTTHISYALELVRTLSPVNENGKGPDIFALPMQENMQARDDKAMTKKYDIGSRTKEANEKNIMFVGATGTGKSTLVDGLANYLMGVRLSDTFRFTLMEEGNKEKQHNQAVSQTDWITTYSFNPVRGGRLQYRLNVIDTPGFGDTRRPERDKNIVDQIRHFFGATGEMGVQTIDAVCFLIKAPDSRLTAAQIYIFNAIMSLFGKDIEGNICTLITFADGSDPPVLYAVYESRLPFGKTFTFNNSALFSNPSNHFTSTFWAMWLHSFESVITHINSLETRSIQLTKEVLQERHCLEVTISNIQFNIKEGLATIKRLHSELRLLQSNQKEINRNAHFTYEVTETKIVKVDLPVGVHVTNCMHCNRTCHEKCVLPDDDQKRRCSAMGPDGYCQQCPNKCFWDLHKNAPFKLDIMTEKVTKTYEDMKKKYEVATGYSMSLEQVIDEMKEELEDITRNVEAMVDNMRTCSNRLKDISFRPNPLGMVEQIDLLIQAEKYERKDGYLGRIEILQQFRDRAEIGEYVKKFKHKAASTTSYLNASVVPEKKKGILSKINWFTMQNK